MNKYKIIMRVNLTSSGNIDYMLKEVEGEPFSLDSTLFVRYLHRVETYQLIDIDSGCILYSSAYYENIEYWYRQYKDKLDVYKHTDAYIRKVKMLKELEESQ